MFIINKKELFQIHIKLQRTNLFNIRLVKQQPIRVLPNESAKVLIQKCFNSKVSLLFFIHFLFGVVSCHHEVGADGLDG